MERVQTDKAERRKGRPLSKDAMATLAATEPWRHEGVSRATWFRRQKEPK